MPKQNTPDAATAAMYEAIESATSAPSRLPLRKIVVKGVGVLKAFETPNPPRLSTVTQFYGPNGHGKTTLAAILKAAAGNDASAIISRKTFGHELQPDVTLIFETGRPTKFENGEWHDAPIRAEVFDSAFIHDNVHAGERVDPDHDRQLFSVVLGRDGVAAQKWQEAWAALAKKAVKAEQEARAALEADLPTGMTPEKFAAYEPSERTAEELLASEQNLTASRLGRQIAETGLLDTIPLPPALERLRDGLAATVDGTSSAARARLKEHFERHSLQDTGPRWAMQGVAAVANDECPFCARPGVDDADMLTIYNQFFSETYRAHALDMRALRDDYVRYLGPEARAALGAIAAGNTRKMGFWQDLVSLPEIPEEELLGYTEIYEQLFKVIEPLLFRKADNPVDPITDNLTPVENTLRPLAERIERFNILIAQANVAIEERKATPVASIPDATAVHERCLRRSRRLDAGVVERIGRWEKASRRATLVKKRRTAAQERLKSLNSAGEAHFIERVNLHLSRFARFIKLTEIKTMMPSNVGTVRYELEVRGNKVARNQHVFTTGLSSGDKTSLALAFFLAKVERESDLADCIIVFDDPVSSYDRHRRTATVSALYELNQTAGQLIVLSHDENFIRLVDKKFRGATDRALYQFISTGADGWSTAERADIDELCATDYARDVDLLKDFVSQRQGVAREVVRAIRPTLETYLRFVFPDRFDRNDWLGTIIEKIRDGGAEHPLANQLGDLEHCNRDTQYHGADRQTGSAETLSVDEVGELAERCLSIVRQPH